jgi:hypothetical protein
MTDLTHPASTAPQFDKDPLYLVQRQTLTHLWHFGHPVSGVARERSKPGKVGVFREISAEIAKPETVWRRCQSNANQSPIVPGEGCLGRQFAPLRQCSGAVLFECGSSVEVAVVIEVIVDRGVCGSELLQGLDVPEAGHRPLSSSEGLV